MDIVNKSTQKPFLLALLISCAISASAYQWLAILIGVWFLLLMGGVSIFRSVNQTAFSTMWGAFFGLTLALVLLVFGPWELYS